MTAAAHIADAADHLHAALRDAQAGGLDGDPDAQLAALRHLVAVLICAQQVMDTVAHATP